MKEPESSVGKLRRKIFAEVARVAFGTENLVGDVEAIPYIIAPTEQPRYRENVYRERAIASERVRLAMGMSLRPQNRPVHITSGLSESTVAEQYYEPPLMQVIPSACEKCPEDEYKVSKECTRCLARSCIGACPVGAVSVGTDRRSVIDPEKCIHCGKCAAACPYHAIIHKERPCSKACGVKAIGSDELGRAAIDPEKCVGCGQCMVACPFGAIADKSQIYQLIRAIRQGDEVIAEVAPAVAGQFEGATLGKLRTALLSIGVKELFEVAHGADLSAKEEAEEYADEVATGKQPFLLTSCCPSWRMLAKRQFTGLRERISGALTPMVHTARLIKQEYPRARVVFIGPCAAKKLEAMRTTVRSDVDFVITFEELAGIFEAKGIDPSLCEEKLMQEDATAAGRGFAVSGGVAEAVRRCVEKYRLGTEVKIERAEGLAECKKMLTLAAHGKKNGCLIEGMACPGGCVAGAGVNLPAAKGAAEAKKFAEASEKQLP